jgi:hypothetical protein
MLFRVIGFRFLSFTSKPGLDSDPFLFKIKQATQNRGDDGLYQIAATSRVDVQKTIPHDFRLNGFKP